MKQLLFPVLLFSTSCMFFSCNSQIEAAQFETISAEKNIDNPNGLSYDLKYDFTYLSSEENGTFDKAIRDSMIQLFFGLSDFEGTPQEAAAQYEQNLQTEYGNDTIFGNRWKGYFYSSSQVEPVGKHLIAYTVDKAEYVGGAHGMRWILARNYDRLNGESLSLDDLFDAEGRTALTEQIQNRLVEQYNVPSIDSLTQCGFFPSPRAIVPTENFSLSADSITFIYNLYEIACYATGIVQVSLSYDELKGFNRYLTE